MTLALEAKPVLSQRGTATGRCESCRQPGRALAVLVDESDSARFEVCDGCLIHP